MTIALSALWASIVRTIVPFVVGWVLTQALTLGIELDPEFEGNLASALTVALGAAYHLAVRLLETHVSPHFGWLLGSAKQPVLYAKPDAAGVPVITAVEHHDAATMVTLLNPGATDASGPERPGA